jgi:hydroxymethylpyrimidine/phosphomethylpyrimidine kinase
LPRAALVTPNADEAAVLSGRAVADAASALAAAERLVERGARAVLVKGGHLPGEQVVDLLVRPGAEARAFEAARLPRGDVRGTGCALASLTAGHLALGSALEQAIELAREGLLGALSRAVAVGSGPPVLRLG